LCRIHATRKDPPLDTTSVTRGVRFRRSTASLVIPQCTVMKSTPSLACLTMPLKMSSSSMSTSAPCRAILSPVW